MTHSADSRQLVCSGRHFVYRLLSVRRIMGFALFSADLMKRDTSFSSEESDALNFFTVRLKKLTVRSVGRHVCGDTCSSMCGLFFRKSSGGFDSVHFNGGLFSVLFFLLVLSRMTEKKVFVFSLACDRLPAAANGGRFSGTLAPCLYPPQGIKCGSFIS